MLQLTLSALIKKAHENYKIGEAIQEPWQVPLVESSVSMVQHSSHSGR